jgi:hypothetical protein
MGTRYTLLRKSIAYFAASPEDQLAHDLGADDAVNDIPYPLEHMLPHGEITPAEIDLIRPLEGLIDDYCSSDGVKPWDDETVLFSDPMWAGIRDRAARILKQLPDEERESDWTGSLGKVR